MVAKPGQIIAIDGLPVKITHPEKELWPGEGITKLDLIRYYIECAPFILPYLKGRPLVVTRYPGGIDGKGFYQKNLPAGAPEWVETVAIYSPDSDREINYIVAENTATLAWLGNQAAIELHPWLSRVGALDAPDYAVFDLDPMDQTTFADVRKVALALKEMLQSVGIEGMPKTTGATGLQVFIPLKPGYTYRQVRDFTGFICRMLAAAFPDITTIERSVKNRQGKIYLDYLQNVQGKTLISPFGARPRPGAPVSVTLAWEEVESGAIGPQSFSIKNTPRRLLQVGDPWQNVTGQFSLEDILQAAGSSG